MTAFQRVKNSLVQQGLRATIFKFFGIPSRDSFFDIRYGTDTSSWVRLNDLTIGSSNKKRGITYQPTRAKPLRHLFKNIASMIPADSVFVDFGCGKGRVLLIASNFCFREVRGVEFAHELCEIAKKNCAIYKRKTGIRTEFQIIESDVVDYSIKSDENIFFMFNPFDGVVLSELLNNLATSLKIQPRRILIIYHNPQYGNVVEQHDKFVKSGEFVLWGNRFTLYSNGD